ncbi:FRG domain-containing protein [Clostridium beijerinckii]|uniref:FRG domain-containing protein n=1 Tax=Clostridium beijerinckii TaxID=1520 RepID=UPI0014941892|nr:FRG domain-containing protein [Clostridium beijerinckii]NOW04431.1 hypothetical protein [Clostridium beijerinckii]NYC02427.1 hypothetical protein [Clostridium beijerinckii]
MCEAKSISEYIEKISDIIEKKKDDFIIVYRGEDQTFSTPCQPNLFRKNCLKKNEFFEKNLFEEMTANKITEGATYLEKAIDAQHDEFPSRLLDVSYNSLVALYFAVTPYYHNGEDIHDCVNEDHINDGNVFIFFIEKLFCPSGETINSTYDSIIKRSEESFISSSIFSKNHKLIDHIKLNKRIIAQQGAFILFQGDEISKFPEADYEVIKIPCNCKAVIRKQLKSLFGIYTGSIYPEPTNLVNEISKKCYQINNKEFNYKNEFELVLYNLEKEINYYRKKIITASYENKESDVLNIALNLEKKIMSYKLGITDEMERVSKFCAETQNKIIKDIISNYNKLIGKYITDIGYHTNKYGIELSKESLVIEEN